MSVTLEESDINILPVCLSFFLSLNTPPISSYFPLVFCLVPPHLFTHHIALSPHRLHLTPCLSLTAVLESRAVAPRAAAVFGSDW